jgi:hypothetical protein
LYAQMNNKTTTRKSCGHGTECLSEGEDNVTWGRGRSRVWKDLLT